MSISPPVEPAKPGRPARNLADLGLRIGSALVMVALALGTLFLGGQAFLLFWLLACVLINWEWQQMSGGPHLLWRSLAGTAALAGAAASLRLGEPEIPLLALLAGMIVLAFLAGPGKRLWAASGLAYAGALLVALGVLRFSNPGMYRHMAILWLFAIVWGTDIMAYFGGRLIGGPKLWPRISPSKTWSGTLTGVIMGAVFGTGVTLASTWFYDTPVSHRAVFVLALLVAAASQTGDLLESAMKRHFGVKDSSTLIPGHGGFMDRLDGFVAASVLAALVGSWRYGTGLAVNGLFQW